MRCRLGHGSAVAELIPRVVAGLRDIAVTNVACGSAHTVALGGNTQAYSNEEGNFESRRQDCLTQSCTSMISQSF